MHEARVLGVALDAREVGLGADALDLELRHERHQLAGRFGGEGDGRSVARKPQSVKYRT